MAAMHYAMKILILYSLTSDVYSLPKLALRDSEKENAVNAAQQAIKDMQKEIENTHNMIVTVREATEAYKRDLERQKTELERRRVLAERDVNVEKKEAELAAAKDEGARKGKKEDLITAIYYYVIYYKDDVLRVAADRRRHGLNDAKLAEEYKKAADKHARNVAKQAYAAAVDNFDYLTGQHDVPAKRVQFLKDFAEQIKRRFIDEFKGTEEELKEPPEKERKPRKPRDPRNPHLNVEDHEEPHSSGSDEEKGEEEEHTQSVWLRIDSNEEMPSHVATNRYGEALTTHTMLDVSLPGRRLHVFSEAWVTRYTVPPTKPNCLCLTRGPLPLFKLIGNLHFKGIRRQTPSPRVTEKNQETICPPCDCSTCFTEDMNNTSRKPTMVC